MSEFKQPYLLNPVRYFAQISGFLKLTGVLELIRGEGGQHPDFFLNRCGGGGGRGVWQNFLGGRGVREKF